jgi:integrase/recombinase XerD
LLSEDEVQRLIVAASEDPRCHSLVYLVLLAGLKKEEVMVLKVRHIDLTDPQTPLITVHFPATTGKQHRERRLALPSEFTAIFKKYEEMYHLTDAVFECTDRNLNYILARAVKDADIKKRVTLQLLRDIFAVEQLRAGASLDALREKLGLSDEAWLESKEKYRRLAFPK